MTLRKVKTVLPSLKPQVEKELQSGVIYEIKCAVCNAAYVGQTGRHLITRLKEHQMASAPASQHISNATQQSVSKPHTRGTIHRGAETADQH